MAMMPTACAAIRRSSCVADAGPVREIWPGSPDETKVHCCRQFAQQMVGGDQFFIDHVKGAALLAVFARHCSNHQLLEFPELVMILAQPSLDSRLPPLLH